MSLLVLQRLPTKLAFSFTVFTVFTCPFTPSQIMAVPSISKVVESAKGAIGHYPPVVFIHMPRDEATAEGVASNVHDLKAMVRAGGWLGLVCMCLHSWGPNSVIHPSAAGPALASDLSSA
jgi:hypothetical protein